MKSNGEDSIQIVAYDPGWEAKFTEEAVRLEGVLPDAVPHDIVHFGSTAVPGLSAKPIIDIAIACDVLEAWLSFRSPIESLGYVYWAENPDREHMFFVKGMPPFGSGRTHHVHVRRSGYVERLVAFRDLLRRDHGVRLRYEELKKELAHRHRLDREAYTRMKTGFIEAALAELHRDGDT